MRVIGLLMLSITLLLGALVQEVVAQPTPPKPSVVYHVDDASVQALRGLRAVRNHLDDAPNTAITMVAHADGVDMFMNGAKDPKSGTEYAPLIADLMSRGVKVYICELTLALRNLKREDFILEVDFTRSGVSRITELQQQNGYAYIKP